MLQMLESTKLGSKAAVLLFKAWQLTRKLLLPNIRYAYHKCWPSGNAHQGLFQGYQAGVISCAACSLTMFLLRLKAKRHRG